MSGREPEICNRSCNPLSAPCRRVSGANDPMCARMYGIVTHIRLTRPFHAVGPAAKLSTSTSLRFQISDFRLQSSDSGPTHDACYSLGTESFSKEQNAHPPTKSKMHSQSKLTSISDFDCTSAFQTSHFKKASDKAMISDFRIGFRFQAHARERNRNREFDFRFQISDSRKGEKSKSGVRFQISYFRLAQGRELKSRVSFQFQVSISGERS